MSFMKKDTSRQGTNKQACFFLHDDPEEKDLHCNISSYYPKTSTLLFVSPPIIITGCVDCRHTYRYIKSDYFLCKQCRFCKKKRTHEARSPCYYIRAFDHDCDIDDDVLPQLTQILCSFPLYYNPVTSIFSLQ